MKKDTFTFLIVLFSGIFFIVALCASYPISINLTYKEEDLEPISLGFSNRDKLLTIDLAYSTLYMAYGSDFKGDNAFLYRNRNFEEEEVSGINNFSIYSRYPGETISYQNLFKNQYIELISVQNEKTQNGYIIRYRLVNGKKEEDLKAYNILETSNQKIMYFLQKEKKEKKNDYKMTSFVKIDENFSLMIEIKYINKNRLSEETIKKLLLSLYQHIDIQKKETSEEEQKIPTKLSTTTPSNEKKLLCVQKNIEISPNCNTTYKHHLTFKNNQFTKYVMEVGTTCSSKESYQKIKSSYKRIKDVQFDDSRNILTYFMGDGYEGTNGNEDLFKNKNIETAKAMMDEYHLGNCEVKE